MDQHRRARARATSSSRRSREDAAKFRAEGAEPEELRHLRRLRALRRRDRQPGPRAAVLGRARDRGRPRRASTRHLDTHVLFKLHWGGRGVKGEAWKQLLEEDFRPRLERMWARGRTTCTRARCWATSPATREGNEIVVLDPEDRETVLERLVLPAPAQGRPHLSLADFYRPKDSRRARRRRAAGRHRGRRGHRADGQARGRRRVRRAAVHPRPRRADRRGHGRVAALARAPRPRHPARRRAAATRGATPRCPSSPSTRRSSGCSTRPSDRPAAVRRLRRRARAVDARDHRPPPAGDLLRHAQRPAARPTARPTTSSRAPRATRRCSASSATTSRPSPARASRASSTA